MMLIEKYISKTPEVVFEVVSPSTAKRDENVKYIIYQGEGLNIYIGFILMM